MAQILGNPFGELRGRIGGQVFSKNAYGAFVRSYVVPTNPDTIAQTVGRTAFTTGASTWGTIPPSARNEWNHYAKTQYVPKNRINRGQYTGYNAYVALKGVEAMSYHQQADIQVETSYGALGGFKTAPLSLPNEPPRALPSNKFLDIRTGEPVTPILTDVTFTEGLTWQFTLKLNKGEETVDLTDFMTTSSNTQGGLAVYISNSKPYPGGRYISPERYCGGYITQPENIVLNGMNNTDFIQFTKTNIATGSHYKELPKPMEYVRFSVYMCDKWGQLVRIGVVETQVQFIG